MPHTDLLLLHPSEAPAEATWVTQEHLQACAEDDDLQRAWEPAVGDWYFCRDLYKVMRINSLDAYYSQGDPRAILKSDLGKDERGHWQCDIYLAPPAPTNHA